LTLRIAPHVAWQIVDGEAVIVDLSSGKTMGLNPSATFIWSHIDGREESQIANMTAEQFGIDRGEAASDVHQFLAEMSGRRVVVEE